MVKFRRRRTTRLARRTILRRLGRRLDRACLRPGRRRGPDDLSQALTAFTRALRCQRRFAKLAPKFFDTTTVDRAARDRAEQRRWMALWQPALNKAYGHAPGTPPPRDPIADLPRLPGPRTQRAVDRELAGWNFWMAAARAAMEPYDQRRPHKLPSWCQLARLLNVAFDLKMLACGDAANDPPPSDPDFKHALAQLTRAYGSRPSPRSSSTPGTAPSSASSQPTTPATAPRSACPDVNVSTASKPPSPSANSQLPTAAPPPAAWPPPDEKRDLTPHAIVIGPHGLLCLQPLNPRPAS